MSTLTQPTRGVLYCRKSSDDAGDSINQQRDWAEEAARQQGIEIVKEFADQSVSGWDTARRSGFAAMLAYCQEQAQLNNPVQVVVCYHTNRFSRSDSLETSRFLCHFRDAGVTRMLTATRWINFHSPEDRMLLGLEQEVSSHRYSTDLSKVTMRGKQAAAAKGLWPGGKAPFGYRVENRKLVPHPEEAKHLRWVFETYANTDVSLGALVAKLRERGVRSPAGKDLWLAATVAKVLRNVLYLGNAVFGRANYSPFVGAVTVKARSRRPTSGQPKPEAEWVKVPNAHEALIDRETFDRVQVRLAHNRGRKSPRKTAPFALSGLLECAKCRRRMIAQTSHVKAKDKVHKYRLYTCASYHANGVASGCGRNTVEEGRVLLAVAKKLADKFTTPDALAALRLEISRQEQAGGPDTRIADLEARYADLDGRIGKLVGRMEEDLPESVMADVRGRLRLLSEDRDRVKAELASARTAAAETGRKADPVERVAAWVNRLQEAVKAADPAATSELLRTLLDRVEVSFALSRQGKRTRAAVAEARIFLKAAAWEPVPSSTLSPAWGRRPSRTRADSARC